MSRLGKIAPALVALALSAAACGGGGPAGEPVRTSFIPNVVDSLDNVGISPSIVVDSKGIPHISYIGVPQEPKPGEPPVARPIGAPVVPAVMVAQYANGLWIHGAAVQTTTGEEGQEVPVTATDETAIAVDADGHSHIAWTEKGILYYSNDTGGSFAKPQKVVAAKATGISIAVDSSGKAAISYYRGPNVFVSTGSGKSWTAQRVASSGRCTGCPRLRTAIRASSAGEFLAFTEGRSKTPMLATSSGGSWTARPLDKPGTGGYGMSLALDANGGAHAAYYAEGGVVRVARSSGGPSSGAVATVGAAASGSSRGLSTGIGVDRKGVEYVAWYDPGADAVSVASVTNGKATPVRTAGTTVHGTSPTVAVTRGGNLYVAWYDRVGQDLLMAAYPGEIGLYAVPSPVGQLSATPAAPAGTCKPGGTTIGVAAKALKFDKSCLAAPANKPFEIDFDNQDAGVPHNVTIFTDSSAKTALFEGPNVTGPNTEVYKVEPLKPGEYYFNCTIHPTTMFGNFIVK